MSRWVELTVQADGIGATLYEAVGGEETQPAIVDETWLTDDEIEEIRSRKRADSADDHIVLGDAEAQTVWVLEESPNGTPQSRSPIGVFSSKEALLLVADELRPAPGEGRGSRSWRWSEHEVDALLGEVTE